MAEQQRRKVIIAGSIQISDFETAGYTDIILSWSPIVSTALNPIDYKSTPAHCDFIVQNNITVGGYAKFSKIPNLIFSSVKITQETTEIFKGIISNVINIGHDEVTIQCVGKDGELSKKFTHEIVELETFPAAGVDAISKMLPVVYGSPKRIPFLSIGTETVTTLNKGFDASFTGNIGVGEWPRAETGYMDIGGESIEYEKVYAGGLDGAILLDIINRGSNPIEHFAGEIVRFTANEHIFAISHPIKEFLGVYIGERAIPLDHSDLTLYTGQTGDEHGTYTGKAVISLSRSKDLVGLFVRGMGQSDNYDVVPTACAPSSAGLMLAYDGDEDTCFDSDLHSAHDLGAYTEFSWTGGSGKLYCVKFEAFTPFSQTSIKQTITITLEGSGKTSYENDFVVWVGTHYNLNDDLAAASWVREFDNQHTGGKVTRVVVDFESVEPGGAGYNDIVVGFAFQTGGYLKIYEIKRTYYLSGAVVDGASIGLLYSPKLTELGVGTVSADVDGVYTDSSPLVLKEHADEICEHILETLCGETDICDDTSYTAAGALYAGSPEYILAFPILQPPNIPELLWRIATQSQSIQYFWLNKHYLKYMTGTYTAGYTVTALDIDQGQAWVKYTDKQYIYNQLIGRFDFYWWGHEDALNNRNSVKAIDGASPSSDSIYGTLKNNISLAYIPGVVQAQAVADWLLSDTKYPRLIVEYIGGLTNNINRKVGDVIAFDVSDTDLNDLLADEVETTDKFLVTNVTYQPDYAIRIECVKL